MLRQNTLRRLRPVCQQQILVNLSLLVRVEARHQDRRHTLGADHHRQVQLHPIRVQPIRSMLSSHSLLPKRVCHPINPVSWRAHRSLRVSHRTPRSLNLDLNSKPCNNRSIFIHLVIPRTLAQGPISGGVQTQQLSQVAKATIPTRIMNI